MASPISSPREVSQDKPLLWQVRVAVLVIVFGVFLSYANSISTPFVFDDLRGIVHNESIRKLWPLTDALSPPMMATGAGGRPIVNLSLAVNYAIGGMDVRGYHIFNMIVHSLAALILLGLVRRTLLRPVLRDKYGDLALPLSFAVSFLWALHPLLTESVTGVIQRTESMGGLFYLLTLYTCMRSVEDEDTLRWQVLCVLSCLIGMATKEIMATVPVIALFYDRTFVAGTFKDAWQQRWRFYSALMATWLLLAYLVVINESRGGMVGFGLGMSSWDYALTQCQAIMMYLKLSLWPNPLVLDYGDGVVSGVGEVWLQGIVLLTLVAATFVALVRKPVVGFVAFTAFSILAPSSSFLPLTSQTMAEHRMYLPLAGVVVLVIFGLYRYAGKWVIPGAIAVSLVAGIATANRNKDYRSVVAIWKDTIEKRPENWRARSNLGASYSESGRYEEAVAEFKKTLRLAPENINATYNIGNIYLRMERYEEAMDHYRKVLALEPNHGMSYYGLGFCLVRTNQVNEAVQAFLKAKEIHPKDATILRSLASSQAFAGQNETAITNYEKLLKLIPPDAALAIEVAVVLGDVGRHAEALDYFQQALRLDPQNARVRFSMGLTLLKLERYFTAANEFRQVIKSTPDLPEGHHALGLVLMGMERWDDAAREFETTLSLDPQYDEARQNLDQVKRLRDMRR